MARPEYVVCIRNLGALGEGLYGQASFCGRSGPLHFMFQGVDEAVRNVLHKGRLVSCSECAEAVAKVLKDDGS